MSGISRLAVEDRLDIMDVVSRMVWYADRRDMEQDAALYDEKVVFDYTALFSGKAVTLMRKDLLAMFEEKLGWFELTHHQVTSTHVNGGPDEVEAFANVRSIHTRRSRTWVFYGYYTIKLRRTVDGWKIFHQQVTPVHEEGDVELRREWVNSV